MLKGKWIGFLALSLVGMALILGSGGKRIGGSGLSHQPMQRPADLSPIQGNFPNLSGKWDYSIQRGDSCVATLHSNGNQFTGSFFCLSQNTIHNGIVNRDRTVTFMVKNEPTNFYYGHKGYLLEDNRTIVGDYDGRCANGPVSGRFRLQKR